jgi:hypothetical protein
VQDAGAFLMHARNTEIMHMEATHDALTFHPLDGVGDIHSTEKGSGARYNSGKPSFDLVPLRIMAQSLQSHRYMDAADAVHLLSLLGDWQERSPSVDGLSLALEYLGTMQYSPMHSVWDECAQVFDYGRKKYAEWAWPGAYLWHALPAT